MANLPQIKRSNRNRKFRSMLNLYFLRHGSAVPRGSSEYEVDSERPLTEKGERRLRKAAIGMSVMGLEFDYILSSPAWRAAATATIVRDCLGIQNKIHLTPHLGIDGDPAKLILHLNKNFPDGSEILLVGHEPFMSRLISMLTTNCCDLQLSLRKSGLCKLAVPKELCFGACANLEWLLAPKQLRALGDS